MKVKIEFDTEKSAACADVSFDGKSQAGLVDVALHLSIHDLLPKFQFAYHELFDSATGKFKKPDPKQDIKQVAKEDPAPPARYEDIQQRAADIVQDARSKMEPFTLPDGHPTSAWGSTVYVPFEYIVEKIAEEIRKGWPAQCAICSCLWHLKKPCDKHFSEGIKAHPDFVIPPTQRDIAIAALRMARSHIRCESVCHGTCICGAKEELVSINTTLERIEEMGKDGN